MIVRTSTPIQIRDRKINDLKAQLSNEKAARRNDKEEFELERVELKNIIARKQEIIEILQCEISNLTVENNAKKEENQALKKYVAELEDKAAVLENRIKKDSSNSSKPPSSDGFKKPRTFSTREKSGRKPGGQPGHVGHYMKLPVEDIEIIERKEGICPCGGDIKFGKSYQSRWNVDIDIVFNVKEERALKGNCKICGKPFTAAFSSQFNAPVRYGNNMASLVSILNEYGNVPDFKTAEIVNSLCGNKINMSPGTVVNIRKTLAKKLEDTVSVIKQRLIDGGLLCVDETGVHVNGGLDWVSVYANDQYTLFEHNQKRSAHCNDVDGILAFFTGILVHDHFKAYYKNKVATHAECNQHILRYLKAVVEIQSHEWAKEMAEVLLNAKALKQERIAAGKNCLTPEELSKLEQRYISILDRGDAEYKAAIDGKKNIRRFREEFCLLRRLREYKDEHLRFISNFNVPFGNNCSEQSVHSMKRKLRTAGCFRSDQGAKNHMAIASVVVTAKKQKKNIFNIFKDTFEGNSPLQSGYP